MLDTLRLWVREERIHDTRGVSITEKLFSGPEAWQAGHTHCIPSLWPVMRERNEEVARGAHNIYNIYQLLEPALLTMDVPADQGDHSTADGTLSRMRRVE